MKVIRFFFGKCGDTLLAKIVYVLMILFIATYSFLSISNTDFTDLVEILLTLFGLTICIGVCRALYRKFLKELTENQIYLKIKYSSATKSMNIIDAVFGRYGETKLSKIIYFVMILYIIVSFIISLTVYTDITAPFDIFVLLLGTLANITILRICYKKLFLKNNRMKK